MPFALALGKAAKKCATRSLCCVHYHVFPSFTECQDSSTRQRIFQKKIFFLCRVPSQLGTRQRIFQKKIFFSLPSARQTALGKEPFAGCGFAVCSLPSVALGKAFAECNRAFAECPRHSAKSASPVVRDAYKHIHAHARLIR